MHQELQRLCPALDNRKRQILLHNNARPYISQMTAEIERTGLRNSTLPSLLIKPLSHRLPLFKHLDNFLQEKVFNNKGAAQNAFEEFIGSRTPEFYVVGINRLVSCWQKCTDSNGLVRLINVILNRDILL
uniref:Histone-lysine N-methyltransferase SETMAR n=1 Tax=Heterorhabditis bacteriophora TaxID=37862 RepID=A0A1I7WXG2_HETBA